MPSGVGFESIAVIIVDDHPMVRAGHRRLLETTEDICVIAEASDGNTGFLLYQKHKPDVLILDLNMTGLNGLETIRRIRVKDPTACILVLSMHDSRTMVRYVFEAGAAGYITKHCAAKEMIQAIRLIKRGRKYISSEMALCTADI